MQKKIGDFERERDFWCLVKMKIVKDTQNYYVCGVEGYLLESEKYWL